MRPGTKNNLSKGMIVIVKDGRKNMMCSYVKLLNNGFYLVTLLWSFSYTLLLRKT